MFLGRTEAPEQPPSAQQKTRSKREGPGMLKESGRVRDDNAGAVDEADRSRRSATGVPLVVTRRRVAGGEGGNTGSHRIISGAFLS